MAQKVECFIGDLYFYPTQCENQLEKLRILKGTDYGNKLAIVIISPTIAEL